MAETKRPIALLSIDTKAVYDRLTKLQVGETVTYIELSAIINRDIRGVAQWNLQSARRKALNEAGMVFGTVSKVGLKRLDDVEIVDASQSVIERAHRMANRGAKQMGVVEYSTLPAEAKNKFNTNASVIGILAHITKPRQVAKIAEKVQQSQTTLPLAKTLEAFK